MIEAPTLPEHNESDASLSQRARAILKLNDMGGYTVPTQGMYPYQWNWDSAFVALGFATYSIDRAIRELETLFEGQWESGMVPHILFRVDDPRYFPGPSVWQAGADIPSSGITQPPFAASAALAIWQRTQDREARARIKALFPRLLASHRWFHTKRDPDGIGVVVMTHPWESGRDNSPEWDAPCSNVDTSNLEPYQRRDLDHADASMRPSDEEYDRYIALLQYGRSCNWDHSIIASEGPFRVADVGMSFILLRADRDLYTLAQEIGGEAAASLADINAWIERGEAGADILWDDETKTFCSRDLITGKASGYVTSGSMLCFYAGAGSSPQREYLIRHFDRISADVHFMMPSFDPAIKDRFDGDRYWRGPCWAVVSYMIATGFAENGYSGGADLIRDDTRTLIKHSGFSEAFNPINAKGSGGKDFSWTAAMWLAWLTDDFGDEGGSTL